MIPGVVSRRLGRIDEARLRIEGGMGVCQSLPNHKRIAGPLRRVFDEGTMT